jgi:hypothetical protein
MKLTQLRQSLPSPFTLYRVLCFDHSHQEGPVESTDEPRLGGILLVRDLKYVRQSMPMERSGGARGAQ